MILPFALGVFVGTALGFTFAGLLVGGEPKARVSETPETDPRQEYPRDSDLGAEGGYGVIRPSAEDDDTDPRRGR